MQTPDALLVPIHLDALFLDNPDSVITAMADFSRLPWFDTIQQFYGSPGGQAVNQDTPYVNGSIVARPFRDRTLRLGRGVHLHWALPDALTQGVNTDSGIVLPRVPDRWLLTRTGPADTQRRWMIQSDYLHPIGDREDDAPQGVVTFPFPPRPDEGSNQPWRYLGRALDLSHPIPGFRRGEAYLNRIADDPGSGPEWNGAVGMGLTAIGYGEPSFAALYSNCRSVFGFHDSEILNAQAFSNVAYDLIGWFDHAEDDCLRDGDDAPYPSARRAIARRRTAEFAAAGDTTVVPLDAPDLGREALKNRFGWQVPEDADLSSVSRILCHAKLTCTGDADVTRDPAKSNAPIHIAIGNTATEALSAHLAATVPGAASRLEEQLEALDLAPRLAHRALDIGPKFQEARHARGFRSVAGGTIFALRVETRQTGVGAGAPPVAPPSIPHYLGHALNSLNETRMAWLRAVEDIDTLRTQIHSDWNLYMEAFRPPDGLGDAYPDPAEVALLIERNGLRALRRRLAATGPDPVLERAGDDRRDAPIVGAKLPPHSAPDSLAARTVRQIDEVLARVFAANRLTDALAALDAAVAEAHPDDVPEEQTFPLPADVIVFGADPSPDGTRIALGTEKGNVILLDTVMGAVLAKVTTSDEDIWAVRFAPNGKAFVTVSESGQLVVRDGQSGTILAGPIDSKSRCYSVDISPDSKRILRGADNHVAVHDLASGAEIARSTDAFDHEIFGIAWSPDSMRILAGDSGGGVHLLDGHTLDRLKTRRADDTLIFSACFDAAGARVATGDDMGVIRIRHAADLNLIDEFRLPEETITSIAFDASGFRIIVGCHDGTARVLDVKTGHVLKLVRQFDRADWTTAAVDRTGTRLFVAGQDGPVRVHKMNAGPKDRLREFLRDLNVPFGPEDDIRVLRDRLHVHAMSLNTPELHSSLADNLTDLVAAFGTPPRLAAPELHYALRAVAAPGYYRPADPVLLLSGPDLFPTVRHGTDGMLDCVPIHLGDIPETIMWDGLPETLEEASRTVAAMDLPDGPGARHWTGQPWHPFLIEWRAEMLPTASGSNLEPGRQGYAPDFVTRTYGLAETAVDLAPVAAAGGVAKPGVYTGTCVLSDHSQGLLLDKLDRYLADAAEAEAPSPTDLRTARDLAALRDQLAAIPGALSQALDGFHDALIQRHRTLQLPIVDPIGFAEMKPLTDAVRAALAGRASAGPLRDADFQPIRAGTLRLRDLRLVDTFGRVATVLGDDTTRPVTISETLRGATPETVALPPRLVQPARLSFRWLAADPALGNGLDEPEINAHPAYSPICGWLLPNNLDRSLMVFAADGTALGSVATASLPVWTPAPGSREPHWSIGTPDTKMNPHLRRLIAAIVTDIGRRDARFLDDFLDTIDTALENIAPETGTTHDGIALLMGRPVAVVRAALSLDLRGRPVSDQALEAVRADLQRAIDAPPEGDIPPRALFSLVGQDRISLLAALSTRNPAALRAAMDWRPCPPPADADRILSTGDGRWRLVLPNMTLLIRDDGTTLRIAPDADRSTDGVAHVRFPVRIGEDRQLNDGLVGYFVENPGPDGEGYMDRMFHAPQAGTPVRSGPDIVTDTAQDDTDRLGLGEIPLAIAARLVGAGTASVTVTTPGLRWRIDTADQVYHLERTETGFALFDVPPTVSDHIRIHWKDPVNVSLAVDDAPLKLTMLVDPTGPIHAVSGILPTQSISIPIDHYADSLARLAVSFVAAPILTGPDSFAIPVPTVDGHAWHWLSRTGDVWTGSDPVAPTDPGDHLATGMRLVEGWLSLARKSS